MPKYKNVAVARQALADEIFFKKQPKKAPRILDSIQSNKIETYLINRLKAPDLTYETLMGALNVAVKTMDSKQPFLFEDEEGEIYSQKDAFQKICERLNIKKDLKKDDMTSATSMIKIFDNVIDLEKDSFAKIIEKIKTAELQGSTIIIRHKNMYLSGEQAANFLLRSLYRHYREGTDITLEDGVYLINKLTSMVKKPSVSTGELAFQQLTSFGSEVIGLQRKAAVVDKNLTRMKEEIENKRNAGQAPNASLTTDFTEALKSIRKINQKIMEYEQNKKTILEMCSSGDLSQENIDHIGKIKKGISELETARGSLLQKAKEIHQFILYNVEMSKNDREKLEGLLSASSPIKPATTPSVLGVASSLGIEIESDIDHKTDEEQAGFADVIGLKMKAKIEGMERTRYKERIERNFSKLASDPKFQKLKKDYEEISYKAEEVVPLDANDPEKKFIHEEKLLAGLKLRQYIENIIKHNRVDLALYVPGELDIKSLAGSAPIVIHDYILSRKAKGLKVDLTDDQINKLVEKSDSILFEKAATLLSLNLNFKDVEKKEQKKSRVNDIDDFNKNYNIISLHDSWRDIWEKYENSYPKLYAFNGKEIARDISLEERKNILRNATKLNIFERARFARSNDPRKLLLSMVKKMKPEQMKGYDLDKLVGLLVKNKEEKLLKQVMKKQPLEKIINIIDNSENSGLLKNPIFIKVAKETIKNNIKRNIKNTSFQDLESISKIFTKFGEKDQKELRKNLKGIINKKFKSDLVSIGKNLNKVLSVLNDLEKYDLKKYFRRIEEERMKFNELHGNIESIITLCRENKIPVPKEIAAFELTRNKIKQTLTSLDIAVVNLRGNSLKEYFEKFNKSIISVAGVINAMEGKEISEKSLKTVERILEAQHGELVKSRHEIDILTKKYEDIQAFYKRNNMKVPKEISEKIEGLEKEYKKINKNYTEAHENLFKIKSVLLHKKAEVEIQREGHHGIDVGLAHPKTINREVEERNRAASAPPLKRSQTEKLKPKPKGAL